MTDLGTKLDGLVFGARGAITPQVVEQARALVVAEGGSPEAVEAFRDHFDSFRSRGYFDAKTRRAIDAAYVALVAALPAEAAPAGGTPEALTARLGQLQGLVTTRKAEVAALTTKLAVTESQITDQAAAAASLLVQKQQYLQTLQKKEKDRQTLLIFALFGAFGQASAAMGLGSAMSINELRGKIAQIDQEIVATQQQKTTLEGLLTHHRADQRTRKRELDALQAAEGGLSAALDGAEDVSALSPEQQVVELRGRIGETQALADNLRQQIVLLREMNEAASGTSGQLDGLIEGLEADLKSLESRVEASEKALLGVVIDLLFKATGTPANLQIGGLSISKKALLLDGLVGLRMQLEKQVDKLVDKMLAQGLVNGGTAPDMAALMVRVLRGSLAAPKAESPAVSALSSEALAALSEPKRLVVDAVLRGRAADPAREAILSQVIAAPALSDAQARAVAAMALVAQGPAAGQQDAIAKVIGDASLSRREAGQAVLTFGLATTYGGDGEDPSASVDRLGPLARRAISFFASDAPAAQALADGLGVLDADPRTPLEDHALLRATLLAGRALAGLTEASADRVALEVLRGWRAASAERSGEGAEDRQLLDATRAAAAMARLLPAGDPLLASALPGTLAEATAHLAAIEAGLATRV